ncbi:hypothetical protein EDD15DRAFT_2372705 [Pisolithus albus]|nr:hypothetical protein EDD15DRAFT_2372705 [Pisolithus albus]
MECQPASTARCAPSSGSPKDPKKRTRAPTTKERLSLQAVHQIKEAGKQTHLRATKTRETYSRHVRQAWSWLQGHFPPEGTPQVPARVEDESEVYTDPGFKDAFERMPNQCSDRALALYLSWRGFQENCSQSTVDGIRAAFKMLWDEADGATFCGNWHHNDVRHRWEGNLVLSAEVSDVVASIRHKVSSDGAERMHSGAMKKEYMDRILTWSESRCSLSIPFHYIRLAMLGYQLSLPGEFLTLGMWCDRIHTLDKTAVLTVARNRNYELVKLRRGDVYLDKTVVDRVFMKYLQGEEHSLTINDLNTYFEIHLKNRKGWQRKLDKGMREADLRCPSIHVSPIYPRPDMGSVCDTFLHLIFWMKWVEFVHLGRPMASEDFLFPATGANRVVQPGEPLSHDVVQAWINEAVAGAGIPGSFSTHCYRRGGAQYRFMFTRVGQRWTLACVRWWGGWAEGEHRDTLMRYLLNELHSYENDHSEAALARPASTEALYTTHASLTADVAALHTTMKEVSSTMATEMKEVKEVSSATSAEVKQMCQQLSHMGNLIVMALAPSPAHSASSPDAAAMHAHQRSSVIQPTPATRPHPPPPAGSQPMRLVPPQLSWPTSAPTLHSHVGPQRAIVVGTCKSNLPPGLLIPNVPVLHADGAHTPKSDSWRDIVHHWTEGEPWLGLHTPLKDWPHHYYNGRYGRAFNTKHYQRRVVATEFLDEFQGDEVAFLKAYGGAAREGHTKLLKAILAARRQHHRDGERRSHFANMQPNSST